MARLARQGRVLIPRGRHSTATRNPHSAVGPRVINPNQLRRRLGTRAMWTRDTDETCKLPVALTSETSAYLVLSYSAAAPSPQALG